MEGEIKVSAVKTKETVVKNARDEDFEHKSIERLKPDDDEVMGIRVITAGNREFTVKAHDRYSLWHIKPKKGPVPKELSGQYTSVEQAQRAIEIYVNRD